MNTPLDIIRRVPWHLVVLGASLCATLYVYLTLRELRRIDAKVEGLCNQMSGLHQATNRRLDDMSAGIAASATMTQHEHAAAGGGALSVDAFLPMLFGGMLPGGGGEPSATVIYDEEDDYCEEDDCDEEDDCEDVGDCDDDDDCGEEGDQGGGDEQGKDDGRPYDDQTDGEQIKRMLLAQIEQIDMKLSPPPPSDDTVRDTSDDTVRDTSDDAVRDTSDDADYKVMRVDELRRILKDAGLDWRGNKDVLVERLASTRRSSPSVASS